MQATVQIDRDGMVVAVLDSDDYAADDDDRALMNLRADDMLDQCAKVAISAWLDVHAKLLAEAGE